MENTGKSYIDVQGIKSMCLDIQNYSEKIKKTLNQIDSLVDASSSYYNDDSRSECIAKKNGLMSSNKTIVDNMNSYIDDFNAIISKYSSFDDLVASNISLDI